MGQQNKIGKVATRVKRENGIVSVKYHNTDVVIFTDKIIILNSGKWATVTTKTRMNQTANQFNLGFQVFQKNFIWYVSFNGDTIEFYDNMRLIR